MIDAVLKFLYDGEAKVYLKGLGTFFKTKKNLKIKGVLERVNGSIQHENVSMSEHAVEDYLVYGVLESPDLRPKQTSVQAHFF